MSCTQLIKLKRPPVVTGWCPSDAAGGVDAVGAGVDHLSVGDAVVAVVKRLPTASGDSA